jgi:glycosyltransferase involved in cell wall biosynthesis
MVWQEKPSAWLRDHALALAGWRTAEAQRVGAVAAKLDTMPRLEPEVTARAAARRRQKRRRIGFVATRLAGTDGVSLEARKWAEVLTDNGHTCFYFAGQCEHSSDFSYVAPRAAFDDPAVDAVGKAAFARQWPGMDTIRANGANGAAPCRTNGHGLAGQPRPPSVMRRLRELAEQLKADLYAFAGRFDLELLVVENALAIPMNLALGLALTEFIGETGMPTIAHHHDFYWERKRFHRNCVADYLDQAFPPRLPTVRHVVINSVAAEQLGWRKGLNSVLVPNVMDFDRPPAPADDYARSLRARLGLEAGERLVLQPTRVVQRKGIEHAIELVRRLERPARLVISHASGDEGGEYAERIRTYAALLEVRVSFVDGLVGPERGLGPNGERRYTLADVYSQADLVTYPSLEEGFGNAFLEAVYFGRPLVVNNYLIYELDIRPKGFHVIEFEDFITECVVRQARELLDQPAQAAEMAAANYELGRRHFSYAMLERRLKMLIADLFGEA